jgi:DNA invertase Pin-like site-specific DNA recombinase
MAAKQQAIIYSRISTTNKSVKTHSTTSLEVQSDLCKEYCDKNDYEVTNIVYEVSSSYNRCPPKLNYLIIPENTGKRIIIYAIDRFSRNTDYGLQLLKEAKNFGIIIDFVSDGFTTENDRHILQIKGEILRAEHESRIIGVRIKDHNKIKRKQGWDFGGKARYGFKFTFKNGIRKLIKNNKEQLVIKFIQYASTQNFSLRKLNKLLLQLQPNAIKITVYDTNGNAITNTDKFDKQSNRDIASLLNSYGISNRDQYWTTSQIRRIIKQNQVGINDMLKSLSI